MSESTDDVAGRVARDLGSIAILMDSERRKAMGAGQHEAAESLAVQANLFAEGERIIRSQAARIEKLEEALGDAKALLENMMRHGGFVSVPIASWSSEARSEAKNLWCVPTWHLGDAEAAVRDARAALERT